MDVQELGLQTLRACRARGWAALETAISRPVPELVEGQVRLAYLLYRSQLCLPHQTLYEPFGRVTVNYASGQIVEHRDLPTDEPPRLLGRYPHAAAAAIPPEQWEAVWQELFGLYPAVIAAFTDQPALGQRRQLARFAELLELTTPPFLQAHYQALNPAFFDWLAQARDTAKD